MNIDIAEEIRVSIGKDKVLTGQDIMDRIPHVWKPAESIIAKALVIPESTEDISAVCRICNEREQAVVVHGGLTNLVRSTESTENDVVISMERMNRIVEIDELGRTMTVEAGAILESIQNEASGRNLLFPMNFGAKGSCQIGGCIAANAGGLRVIRYGMTRNLVLGLEYVLADGTIISSLQKILKNNTGYDLKHLMIGSEGTLGVITKAVLRLYERPVSRNSAFAACDSFENVLRFMRLADNALGGQLSAYEFFWDDAYHALTSGNSPYKPPLPYGAPYYVLFESLGSNRERDEEDFQRLLEDAWDQGLISDAAMAHSESDLQWFWNIREDVGQLLSIFTYRQDFDISLPQSEVETYVLEVKKKLNRKLGITTCFAFGHLGDGNIHLLVDKPEDTLEMKEEIDAIVYAPLAQMHGSVSAEHGIGIDKKKYIGISRSADEIDIMKKIKAVVDPNGIMNPGKIFPS
jgi:FAD/FMN-containing dehydrogenase